MPYWDHAPIPIIPLSIDILIIDGLYLETRNSCVLIGRTKTLIALWLFADRECYGSWLLFCRSTPAPRVVVCDGQRGMRAAIRDVWPYARVQRCMFHVYQLISVRLTNHPKTDAGRLLLSLAKALFCVQTRRQKGDGSDDIFSGKNTMCRFLKNERQVNFQERSVCGGIPTNVYVLFVR